MLINLIKKIRAKIIRLVKPKSGYFMFRIPKKSVKPLSTKYGFDRGKPIDRYYIESFLEENKQDIKGACLEITDNDYTLRFGGDKLVKSDALDIDRTNKRANIYGDLRKLDNIKNDTYDCLIITQTLVMIDDYEAAIRECWRILKPGGVILVTMPSLGRVGNDLMQFWRFTVASAKYVFNKCFASDELLVKSYGNALSGQCFWVGLSTEEMAKKELDYYDPVYPVIVAIRAVKKSRPKKI